MPCLLGYAIVPEQKRGQRVHSRGGERNIIHTCLINESSAALTNIPTPADSCMGSAYEAGLSIDA